MTVPLRRSTRKRTCVDFRDQLETPTRNFSSGDPDYCPKVRLEKIASSNESEESNLSEDESPIPNEGAIPAKCSQTSTGRMSPSPCTSPFIRKLMSSRIATNNSPEITDNASKNCFYGSISKAFEKRATKLGSSQLSFTSSEESELDAIDVMRKIVGPSREIKSKREKRVLISQNLAPKLPPKINGVTKPKCVSKLPNKKKARKQQGSSFMKKSMLETRQPQTNGSNPADEVEQTPVKRKFFSSSAKEKKLLMTTTLFGKQKVSAATVLNKNVSAADNDKNEIAVPGKTDMPNKTTSKKSSERSAPIFGLKAAALPPESLISNISSCSDSLQTDFNDIDPMLGRQQDVPISQKEDLEPSDTFSLWFASSNKENQSIGSPMQLSIERSPVQEQRSFSLRSPTRQAVMQHYHYSPPTKANSTLEPENLSASDSPEIGLPAHSSSTCSPITDSRMIDLFENTDSDGSRDEIISGTPQKGKQVVTCIASTRTLGARKRMTSAWPIHYSAEKEKLSNLKSNTSPSVSVVQKSRSKNKDCKEQLIIDAGQKEIGAKMCFECGMFYNPDSDEDAGLHIKVHNTVITNLRFQGWKKERVVREFMDGRVLLILPEDPKYALKKMDEVKQVLDTCLGFHEKAQPDKHTMQVYFFIMEKKIVGCLIAEAIKQAFQVIPSVNVSAPLACSTQPEKALCGVNRIWTLATHRRRNIASRLIDCMRTRFYFGCEVGKEQIAFSDPTPDGRKFATSYIRSENFLVYK